MDGVTPGEGSRDTITEGALDSGVRKRLARHAVVPEHLIFEVPSPDSRYIALGVDSIIRFGPGDEMWPDEWPETWFGVRSRRILYLYDPRADSLVKLTECEEVVNLYLAETSTPIQAERRESLEAVRWSPDSKRLLLLKDREADGVRNQDVLIFTLGEEQPAFLEIFPVWMDLVQGYDGAKGTKVADISWVNDSSVRVVFSILGVESAAPREVIFDIGTGQVISVKELAPT